MRLNQYLASATGCSRRAADELIKSGRVRLNGNLAEVGRTVQPGDNVLLDSKPVIPKRKTQTILFHKPTGFVCSRSGQGSDTVYSLLPAQYHDLKIAGRLDKDSSGLVILTNDGLLLHQLTHPRFEKEKVYLVNLNNPLFPGDRRAIERGIILEDGTSRLLLSKITPRTWQVRMSEGRNRQIRRTFAARGYAVTSLHRIQIGPYRLGNLANGKYSVVP